MNRQIVPQFLSLKEFVEHSQLSESTIRRRVREGSLRAVQAGGKYKKILFPIDALTRLSERTPSTQPDNAAEITPLPPSTGTPTDTHAGPRPRWARNLPRRPK